MITPTKQDLTAYVGSTFDQNIVMYSSNPSYTWTGAWLSGTNYSFDEVVIGTDSNAYLAIQPNVNVNPLTDTAHLYWSTPLPPLDLNGYKATITMAAVSPDEILGVFLSTPCTVQGASGLVGINLSNKQSFNSYTSSTPTIFPGQYHYYLTLTDPNANQYYYMNGNFFWNSP